MANGTRRKTDPLAPPPGGWPERPLLTTRERMAMAERLWSIRSEGLDRREFVSAELIERQLRGLARNLLHDLRNRDALPTTREYLDDLNELARTARSLLAQLDRFIGDDGKFRLMAIESVFYRYGADWEARWNIPEEPDLAAELDAPLRILASVAADEAEDIATLATGPGHQRLHDRLFYDPRYTLGIRAAWIVGEFCGRAAVKTTEGGIVHTLMNDVWSDATGLDPEDYNLLSFLKKGFRDFRPDRSRPPSLLYRTVLNRQKKRELKP